MSIGLGALPLPLSVDFQNSQDLSSLRVSKSPTFLSLCRPVGPCCPAVTVSFQFRLRTKISLPVSMGTDQDLGNWGGTKATQLQREECPSPVPKAPFRVPRCSWSQDVLLSAWVLLNSGKLEETEADVGRDSSHRVFCRRWKLK